VIEPWCGVLSAKLPATLSEADENQPNTLRIQEALDHCAAPTGEFCAGGDYVKVTGAAGKGSPNACEGKFVPLPAR
jgi:hypothetical protein